MMMVKTVLAFRDAVDDNVGIHFGIVYHHVNIPI